MATNSNVDQRIIEMRIDNDKFEAGAKKTLDLLDKLDQSLNGLGKVNSEGFDNVAKTMDVVNNKFSVMGTIGDQVIRNLTNKMMELVSQFKNMSAMLTTQQISAGWNKYAEKTTAVQTIMAATNNKVGEGQVWADQEEQLAGVNEQLKRLTWFADETSYSFTDMVNNVGKFTAAGRDLEESVTAMQGISTWAAISGGRPAEAGRAMYNLSQALGLGAVTTIDWKSIELANMATYEFKKNAIDTAVELGKLRQVSDNLWQEVQTGEEVTIENFRNSLTIGRGTDAIHWFDTDVLLSVLNKYGGFAQEVQNAVNGIYDGASATFVLKDLKKYEEALQSSGKAEDFLRSKSEELGTSVEELRAIFDRMLSPEYDLGRRAFQAAQEAKTFGEAIDAAKDAVSTKWMDLYEVIFGDYLQAKEVWTGLAEMLWNVFAGPVDKLKDIISAGFGAAVSLDGTAEGMQKAAGSTESFEAKLSKVGKTMKDFEKALTSVMDPRAVHPLVEMYGSLGEAFKNGAISEELFRQAIVAMDDSESKTMSLQKALVKNKKTMQDFEKAVYSVADRAAIDAIENFGSVEEALKRGALSADLFKKALELLGINSEDVTQNVEQTVKHAVGSLDDMRKVALEILRGDWGNGDERRKALEEAGYDYELMQAMAGDLQSFFEENGSYEMSDEKLMEAMEKYYQYMQVGARLGYETFEEFLASAEATNEELYTMDSMLNESADILRDIYGNDVFVEGTNELKTYGDLFREGLLNLMEFFTQLTEVFDEAFTKVFGGEAENAVTTLGSKFSLLALNFHKFTESLSLKDADGNPTQRFLKLQSILEVIMKVIQVINTVLGIGLKLVGKLAGLAFKLAGIIADFLTGTGITSIITRILDGLVLIGDILGMIIDIIGNGLTGGLDSIRKTVNELTKDHPILMDLFNALIVVGGTVLTPLIKAFDYLRKAVQQVVYYFNLGYENGGFAKGMEAIIARTKVFLKDHPILLDVFNTLVDVATVLWHALSHVGDAFLFIGGIVATAFGGVFVVLGGLFEVIKNGLVWVYNWVKSNETLNAIITSIGSKLRAFAGDIKVIARTMRAGYNKNGLQGALDAFARTIKIIWPKTGKISSFFESLRESFAGLKVDTSKFNANFKELGTKISDAWNKLFAPMDGTEQKTFGEKVKAFLMSIWLTVLDFIRQVKITDVIKAFRLGLIASLITEVAGAITVFKNIGKSVKEIPDLLAKFVGGIVETVKSFAANVRADTVGKMAWAMLVMAGAFYVMSRIPEDQLTHVAVISGIMIYLLTQLAKMLQTSKLFGNGIMDIKIFQLIPNVMGILIGAGFALVSFAASMLILTHLDEKKTTAAYWSILGLITTIVVGMIALMAVLKGFNGYKLNVVAPAINSLARAMTSIAFAVQMLILPVVAFSLIQNLGVSKFKTAIVAVIGLIAIMTLAVWRITKSLEIMTPSQIEAVGKSIKKIAGSMKGLAFAVGLLALSITGLTAIQNLGIGKFRRAAITVVALISVMALLVGAFVAQLAGIDQNESKIDGMGYTLWNIGNTLLKAAGAMVIVAVAVGLLSNSVIRIAKVSDGSGSVLGAFGIVALLIAGLSTLVGIFVAELSRVGDYQKMSTLGTTLMKAAAAMVIVAAAVGLLTKSVLKIADFDGSGKKLGAVILVGAMTTALILAFVGIAALLNKLGGQGGNGAERIAAIGKALIGLGAAFALFAVGMAFLTPIISVFIGVMGGLARAVLNMDNLFGVMLKLVGVSAAVFVFGFALSWLAIALVGIAGAFTIFSLGLLIFVGAAIAFAKNADIIKEALPKLVEGLAEAGKLLQANWKDILIITGVIAVFTLAFSVLLGWANKKHGIIGKITGFFTTLFTSLAGTITKGVGSVGKGFYNFFKKLPAYLRANEKGILDIIIGLIGVIGLYITGIIPTLTHVIVDAIIATLNAIGNELNSRSAEVGAAITNIVHGIISVGAEVIRGLFNKEMWDSLSGLEKALAAGIGITAVLAAFNKITKAVDGAKGITGALGKAKVGVTALCDTIGISVGGALGVVLALGAAFAYAAHYSNEQQDILRQSVGDPQTVAEYEQSIANLNAELARMKEDSLLYEQSESFYDEMRAKTLLVQTLTNELEELKTQEQETAAAVSTGLGTDDARTEKLKSDVQETKTALAETEYSLDTLQGKISSFLGENGIDISDFITADGLNGDALVSKIKSAGLFEKFTGLFSGLGEDANSGLGTSILENVGIAESGMSSMLEALFNHTKQDPYMDSNSPSKAYANIGKEIPPGLGVGITDNQIAVTSSIATMLLNMFNSVKNSQENFQRSASYIVAGLVTGISQNMQYAYNSGVSLGRSLENGFRSSLRIKSPSRVFAELASYIPMGVAEGINENQNGAITSIVGFSSELLKAMELSMAKVATIAEDEFEWSPTITPVVDMHNITEASRSIGGIFSKSDIGASARIVDTSETARRVSNANNSGNIMAQISELNNQINTLGEKITNMQIVLDTGVLVGATSARMDRQLGVMASRKARGN